MNFVKEVLKIMEMLIDYDVCNAMGTRSNLIFVAIFMDIKVLKIPQKHFIMAKVKLIVHFVK